MKALLGFLTILSLLATEIDFSLSLAYYSFPLSIREWSLTIERRGDRTLLTVDKYRGLTRKIAIPRKIYLNLIGKVTGKGIWTLQDYYRENSPNGFYIIEVKREEHVNRFRVEYGIPLTGTNARYREIIRSILNTTNLLLSE